MKKINFLLVCVLLLSSNALVHSQAEPELYDLLQKGKYVELVNKVCSLREKAYYKNAFMDYCLAYGYCQLNKPDLSGEWFDHILASYNSLSTSKRAELSRMKESCVGSHPSPQASSALFGFLQGMSTDGFQGSQAGVESKMGVPSLSDTVEELDFEHLTFDTQNRRFSLQQKPEALAYYKSLLSNPNMNADTTSHFLVFYPGNPTVIKDHVQQMEQYYSFYGKMFGLQESNRLITVFYCTSRNDLNQVARRVHNIPVPKSTFGYASSIDLVMLGIANSAWLGAMKHELFHLMIRAFVGDIPPWLDEGTACYFESSNLTKDGVTTNLSSSNYRIRLLQNSDEVKYEVRNQMRAEFKVPSLNQLTNFNWQEFSGKPGDLMIKASFNQSLSYAFVSFLQDKNLLSKTIDAFRNRSFSESAKAGESSGLTLLHLRTNDELLTNITGMQIAEIQNAFIQWCHLKGFSPN